MAIAVRNSSSAQEIPISGARVQLLAARLILDRHGGGLSRHELADTVWGDYPPGTWASALRGLLSKARRALAVLGERAEIVHQADRYWLRLDPSVTVDVEEAIRCLADPAAAGEPGVVWAMNLLTRPVLGGLDGAWIRDVQTRLAQQRIEGLVTAGQWALDTRRHALATTIARQALLASPLSDRCLRLLLSALLENGDRGQAITEFTHFRRRLDEELGVRPEPATQHLYLQALGESPNASSGRAADPLPARVSVYGLAEELSVAENLWNQTKAGRGGHLRVGGERGSGKSLFLRELVRRLGGTAETVIVCEKWDTLSDGAVLGLALERALARRGMETSARHDDRWIIDQLTGICRSGDTLLVIDDLDQADPTSRRVLDTLLSSRRWPSTLMAVSTTKSAEESPNDPPWSTLPQASPWIRVLKLKPWGIRELRALTKETETVRGRIDLDKLRGRSGGNPFLAVLLTTSSDETAARRIALSQFLPDHHQMDETEQLVLEAIAAAGSKTEHDVLVGMTGLSDSQTVAAVSRLTRSRLLREAPIPGADPAQGGIRFVHGILGEALRDNTPAAKQNRLLNALSRTVLVHSKGTLRCYVGSILERLPAEHLKQVIELSPPSTVERIRHAVLELDTADAIHLIRILLEILPKHHAEHALDLQLDLARLLLGVDDLEVTNHLLDAAGRSIQAGDLPRAMEATRIMEDCYRRWPNDFPHPGPALDLVSTRLRISEVAPDCLEAAKFTAAVLRHGQSEVPAYAIDAAILVLADRLEQDGRTPATAHARGQLAEDLWAVASCDGDNTNQALACRFGLSAGSTLNDLQLVRRFEGRLSASGQVHDWARPISADRERLGRFFQGVWNPVLDTAAAPRQGLIAQWAGLGDGAPCSPAMAALTLADGPLLAVLRGASASAQQQLRLVVASLPLVVDDDTLHDLGVLTLAATEVNDRAVMRLIMDRLLPFADLSCARNGQTSVGSVALHLGRLARRLDQPGAAEEYLDLACAIAMGIEQPLWAAIALREHAAVIEQDRSRPDHAAHAMRTEAARMMHPPFATTPHAYVAARGQVSALPRISVG